MGYPMVCMDARRVADAIKSRRIKSDKADAFPLDEMLRTGWFSPVHVKSLDCNRLKTLLGARDQLVNAKRSLGNQVRGLLRPFGIRLPSRVGAKKFAAAAYEATQADRLMHAGIAALLESLASIDAQVAKLDDGLKELARRSNEVAWRLMSVPGVGPVTALAFIAAIQNVEMGISKQRRCDGEALSLRGRQCAVDHGQEALRPARLGPEADEEARPEAGARGGGEEARCSLGARVEGWCALRRGCRGMRREEAWR
jgi:transposase